MRSNRRKPTIYSIARGTVIICVLALVRWVDSGGSFIEHCCSIHDDLRAFPPEPRIVEGYRQLEILYRRLNDPLFIAYQLHNEFIQNGVELDIVKIMKMVDSSCIEESAMAVWNYICAKIELQRKR